MIRFVLLAFGITWLAVAPLVLAGLGLGPAMPGWLHGAGALGPVLAAHLSERERGILATRTTSSLSFAWSAACLLTPLFFAAVALHVVALRGSSVVQPLLEAARNPDWLVGLFVGAFVYGFGEEPGWRGWLLPRLQRRFAPIRATMILALIWAAWHLPFFLYRFDFEGPGTIVGFFVGLLAGAFWLTFLFNSSGGSVWMVAWWHVAWNVSNIALAAVSSEAVAILNGLMVVLGFSILAVFGRRGLSLDGTVTLT